MSHWTPEELGRCFDAHAAALALYARQLLDPALAEDVVQDVFLRLMEQAHPPQNVKAWLFRSVRNAAISHVRSQRRRRQREQEIAAGHREWFESNAEALIDAEAAQQALAKLPVEQREIIVLRIWAGMTLAEAGQTMGMPVSSVHELYRAALAALRCQLESPCRKT